MDPITEGVIAGLLTEGLMALVAAAGRDPSPGPPSPSDLRSLLQRPATALARALGPGGAAGQDRVARFLVSQEVETLLRALFVGRFAENGAESVAAFEGQFIALYGFIVGEADAATEAPAIFNLLVQACDTSLQLAAERGILGGLDARAVLRHRQLQARLEAIEQNITFLRSGGPVDLATVEGFGADYLHQVQNRFGYIIPQSFDRQRKLPIDDLFVAPRLYPDRRRVEYAEAKPWPMSTAIAAIDRTVLLGNPGGGKSTFAHKLAHLLASEPERRHIAGRRLLLPFFVTLRDYADEKARNGLSLLQFMAARINSDLQLPVPEGVLEYLLRTGRALVVFDGLDELLDTHRRREVSADVESFGTRFPDCALLVTSREVGYDEAPLDERRFQVLRIAPFDEQQARDYVTKWFNAEEEMTPDERKRSAESFLSEAKQTPDLLESPLMLALLCTLYRGAGYLPRNRPAIYLKCADMMFDRGDRQCNIRVSLQYQSHLFYAMQHLAYWIYTGDGLAGGVCEGQLIAQATDYMADYCADNRVDAEAAAKDFIAFCRGRAWVFSDAGTRGDGERLYAFTHRTFLEYFTAAYLARNSRGAEALAAQLLPRVREGQWDVVAQLACHIQDQAQAGSADAILRLFLDEARSVTAPAESYRLYAFMAHCLAFLVPRPVIRCEIVAEFLHFWLGHAAAFLDRSNPPPPPPLPSDGKTVYLSLIASASENRPTVLATIEGVVTEILHRGPGCMPSCAAELALLTPERLRIVRSHDVPHLERPAELFGAQYIQRNASTLLALATADVRVAWFLAKQLPSWSEMELLEHHGFVALVSTQSSQLFGFYRMGPTGSIIQALARNDYFYASECDHFCRVAERLLETPTPWIMGCKAFHWESVLHRSAVNSTRGKPMERIPSGVLFLAFSVGALVVECSANSQADRAELFRALEEVVHFSRTLQKLMEIWRYRIDREVAAGDFVAWPFFCFSSAQERLVRDWMERKIDLVGAGPNVRPGEWVRLNRVPNHE